MKPHSFPIPSKEKFLLDRIIFSTALSAWLWEHIRDYDIIHTHYLFSYPSTCAGLIARCKGIPYIVRTIGQLTPWALAQSSFKKQIYTSLIERHNLNRAAAIHCTSDGEAEVQQLFIALLMVKQRMFVSLEFKLLL